MPRSYRLGKRSAEMRATRDRIVEAAIDLAIEVGLSKASMRQIGLRADVAPGTLRNHFPTRRSLELAMVEQLTGEVPLPDPSIFDGADTLEARVERFMAATGVFFDRAGRLYRMWLREPMLTSPWSEAGAAYGARWAELQRLALGPLADDPEVQAVFRGLLDIPFFDRVRGGNRSTEQVSALISAAIVPWLLARAEASTGGRGSARVAGRPR